MALLDLARIKASLEIETDSIRIKPLSVSHVTRAYIEGLNDPDVNRFLVDVKIRKQTRETVERFILENRAHQNALLLGIFLKEAADLFIGTVRLSGISTYHYCADIGICLFDKTKWGKGYALQALQAVTRFSFDCLELHYLEAGVYTENIGSLRAFEKSGFRGVHTFRKKYRHEGRFADVEILGIYNQGFDLKKLANGGE